MKCKLIYGICLLALLAICGCKTPDEKREEVARDRKLNERLDDIQQQLLAIKEKQAVITTTAVSGPTLNPVVPVKKFSPVAKPRVTIKTKLKTLSRRYNLKPVSRKSTGSRKTGSKRKLSFQSLRKKHIRVGIPVRVIQQALAGAGCSPGKIDGRVGAKTVKAIIKFQKREGLPADGVVGPVTWAHLRNAGS